jgi:hypothetical protein
VCELLIDDTSSRRYHLKPAYTPGSLSAFASNRKVGEIWEF